MMGDLGCVARAEYEAMGTMLGVGLKIRTTGRALETICYISTEFFKNPLLLSDNACVHLCLPPRNYRLGAVGALSALALLRIPGGLVVTA